MTASQRAGPGDATVATTTASFQVAAPTIGGAAVRALIGLVIGALGAAAVAPLLLGLSLALLALYVVQRRSAPTVQI
ncbi:MAG TPA: hypothetical protein VMF65_12560 [Acidimicrobiales bacterium]|nr:hypothetical protein [Acidimicrobiales bacterium]